MLFLAAVFPYLITLHFGFVYDDDIQVLENPAIRSWHLVPTYFAKPISFFTNTPSAHYYRPLFFAWFRLNYFLWGTHPLGWHLSNLLLHGTATILAFLLLQNYLCDVRWALAAALLFAVHPVHVETVAWVSGSTDALLAVFLLASLVLWLKAFETDSQYFRAASLLCSALALLTKETAVVLPALIFFHSFMRISFAKEAESTKLNSPAFALLQTAPYLGLTAIYLAVRYLVMKGAPLTPPWVTIPDALFTIPSLIFLYGSHLLWPWKLGLFYAAPLVNSAARAAFWLPLLSVLVITATVFRRMRRTKDPRLALAWCWFLLPLAPVLYIRFFQPDDFVHDRYLYLPVLAISLLGGMLAEKLAKSGLQFAGMPLLTPVLGMIALCLCAATVLQTRPWESNLLLYTNAAQVTPSSAMARNNLSNEYTKSGRYVDAADLLQSVLRDRPDMWLANYNYGYVNYQLQRHTLAEAYLRKAIRIDAGDPDQYLYLGLTLLKEGRIAEAEEQVRLAIARKPDGAGYHLALAVMELQFGRLEAAREQTRLELQYHPENALAVARLQAGLQ